MVPGLNRPRPPMPLLATIHVAKCHSRHETPEGVANEDEEVKHYLSRFNTELNIGTTVTSGLEVTVLS